MMTAEQTLNNGTPFESALVDALTAQFYPVGILG